MQLKIGENIKRLRRERNITQEQLAELLNVSCAAVSKWEHSDTYPDITIIFPIAHYFGVSTDELMGYNAAHIDAEIDQIISQYQEESRIGKFAEARKRITKARKDYPNDYRIMHYYMWDIAGGCADNDSEVLTTHTTEFSEICDCILNGCKDEYIRLEAMTMKAKLLHADGETGKALEILEHFPSWYQTSGQKGEQLFAKDTAEFHRCLRLNLYELSQFTANKMVKAIWYNDGLSIEEKTAKAEEFGDTLTQLRQKNIDEALCLVEFAVFAELTSKLIHNGGSVADITRCRDKQLAAAKCCSELAKKEDLIREHLIKQYSTDDLLKWVLDLLKNTIQKQHVLLREDSTYTDVLKKYGAK